MSKSLISPLPQLTQGKCVIPHKKSPWVSHDSTSEVTHRLNAFACGSFDESTSE